MDTLITVATFQYPHEAYIIKGRLEAEGIFVFLKDELTVQAHNFLSNAIGGVKLQVYNSDLEKALPILESVGLTENDAKEQAAESTISPRPNEFTTDLDIRCIYCQSDNVAKSRSFSSFMLIPAFIVGVPFPFFKIKYHCFDCGKDFKMGKHRGEDIR